MQRQKIWEGIEMQVRICYNVRKRINGGKHENIGRIADAAAFA